MRYEAIAESDKGIVKETNQDSVLIKHGMYKEREILMAIVCDGMGGLSSGEIASATVVKKFADWFDNELPRELEKLDMSVIGGKWELLLKNLNRYIGEYGIKNGERLGTTFTGVLFVDGEYVAAHVGDSRLYYIDSDINQLTEDQTFIAREIKKGTMTLEQARTDKRRNMLLQCVGASEVVEPEIFNGKTQKGIYMICSDGFRHEISEKEILENLKPAKLKNKDKMKSAARYLIDLNMKRQEKDNISVLIIKTVE